MTSCADQGDAHRGLLDHLLQASRKSSQIHVGKATISGSCLWIAWARIDPVRAVGPFESAEKLYQLETGSRPAAGLRCGGCKANMDAHG